MLRPHRVQRKDRNLEEQTEEPTDQYSQQVYVTVIETSQTPRTETGYLQDAEREVEDLPRIPRPYSSGEPSENIVFDKFIKEV